MRAIHSGAAAGVASQWCALARNWFTSGVASRFVPTAIGSSHVWPKCHPTGTLTAMDGTSGAKDEPPGFGYRPNNTCFCGSTVFSGPVCVGCGATDTTCYSAWLRTTQLPERLSRKLATYARAESMTDAVQALAARGDAATRAALIEVGRSLIIRTMGGT